MIDFHVVYQITGFSGHTAIRDTFCQLEWTPNSPETVIALKKLFIEQIQAKEAFAVEVFILSYYPIL